MLLSSFCLSVYLLALSTAAWPIRVKVEGRKTPFEPTVNIPYTVTCCPSIQEAIHSTITIVVRAQSRPVPVIESRDCTRGGVALVTSAAG